MAVTRPSRYQPKATFSEVASAWKIDKNYFGLNFLQQLVREPETDRPLDPMKDASLEIDHGVAGAVSSCPSYTPQPGMLAGKFAGRSSRPRWAVRIAIRHLKIFNDLAFCPRHDCR